MDIAKILRAELTGSSFCLVVEDTNGRQQRVSWSRRAEEQALTAFLSAPPVRDGQPMQRGPFVPTNFRAYETKDGTFSIEVSLTPKAAIHIALPGNLRRNLVEILTDPKWPTAH